MNSFSAALIDAVKEETVLYARSEDGCIDKCAKLEAWERVSLKIGKPAEECEKRWQVLRERFGRENRKKELATASGAVEEVPWPFFESMSFLKEHIRRRRRRTGNKTFLNSPKSESSPLLDYYESVDVETLINSTRHDAANEEESPSLGTSSRRKKAAYSSRESKLREFSQVLEADIEKITTKVAEQTEDELFMKTALKMIEPLPTIAKDKIKTDIFKLITAERKKLLRNLKN